MFYFRVVCCAIFLVFVGCKDSPDEFLDDAFVEQFEDSEKVSGFDVPVPGGQDILIWDGNVVTSMVSLSGVAASHICVGFGDQSSAHCVPVTNGSVNSSSSRVSLDWLVPTDMCDEVKKGCQEGSLFSFAVLEDGRMTEPVLSQIVTACDSCDSGTCEELVEECTLDSFCLTGEDCGSGNACLRGSCVGSGRLHFALTWSATSDLDLYVRTPSGSIISYLNKTGNGGELDHDDTSGGPNSIENVYFDSPESGEYEVWVQLYSGGGGAYTLTGLEAGQIIFDDVGLLDSSFSRSEPIVVDYR